MLHNYNNKNNKNISLALFISGFILIIFALIEAIGGYLAHSLVLYSDAAHLATDAFSLFLASLGAWLAQRPPSITLSYGYGRFEVIMAIITTLSLVLVISYILVEAIFRLKNPHLMDVNGKMVMLIAFFGCVINSVIIYILHSDHEDLNTRAAVLHVLTDLFASLATLIAGGVIFFTHWMVIDPILSLIISLSILWGTVRILREAFGVLMEGVPVSLNLRNIGNQLAQINGVQSIHDLHVWTLSSHRIMLTAHIDIDDIKNWEVILEQIKSFLSKKYNISHITIQPEVSNTALLKLKIKK